MPDLPDWLSLAPQPSSFWDALLRLAVAALAGGALRPAMATILVFFAVGLAILLFVRDERI